MSSPTSKTSRKASNSRKKPEQPKLKMMDSDANEGDIFSFFNNKKGNRGVSNSSKIITIGNTIFRSNFESGNLYSVTRVSPNTYEIDLTTETNSQRISAWFYFCVEGLKG